MKILIVDYGGQYTHLIGRRLKDIGITTQVISADEFNLQIENVKGYILSGGPKSVGEDGPLLPDDFASIIDDPTKPVLGICYGHQLLAETTGGKVNQGENREYGRHKLKITKSSNLLPSISKMNVWMSHGDSVVETGDGYEIVGSTNSCPIAMVENKDKHNYSVQFHPEVTHTDHGNEILENFAFKLCNLSSSGFDMDEYTDSLINQYKQLIGQKRVILGVSGGVDSTVTALILHKAIGENLHCVFIDHGLLRKNEKHEVEQFYANDLNMEHFHSIDASEQFLSKLEGISDPEEKRRIIGHTFIETFEDTAISLSEKYGKFHYLAQGTIYSDRIESGATGASSSKIKSHHNLTLPDKMNLDIVEPLKELYKDEVRKVGRVLGGPDHILDRYPFPGPGLAIRILGAVSEDQLRILREADNIFISSIYEMGLEDKAWQAFAVLLPVSAVGVQGDNRSYGKIIALRAVQSKEGMTADFSKFEMDFLGNIATEIINQIPEITRVVYDISTKPPATIEFE